MKTNKIQLLIAGGILLAATGCQNMNNMNMGGILNAGDKAIQAATLSDQDVQQLTVGACAEQDKQNKIAPASNNYAKRVAKISKNLPTSINNAKLDFKVYLTKDVNAWAMANGCVRVYSGLMDLMNDDEVRAVLGHEIGHVALGHTRKAIQAAYAVSAARDAAGAAGSATVAALNSTQLADLGEKLINAQFSQSQESQADDYSFDMLKAKGLSAQPLVSSFQKLATLDGGASSIMSSHPSSPDRAKHISDRIKANK